MAAPESPTKTSGNGMLWSLSLAVSPWLPGSHIGSRSIRGNRSDIWVDTVLQRAVAVGRELNQAVTVVFTGCGVGVGIVIAVVTGEAEAVGTEVRIAVGLAVGATGAPAVGVGVTVGLGDRLEVAIGRGALGVSIGTAAGVRSAVVVSLAVPSQAARVIKLRALKAVRRMERLDRRRLGWMGSVTV